MSVVALLLFGVGFRSYVLFNIFDFVCLSIFDFDNVRIILHIDHLHMPSISPVVCFLEVPCGSLLYVFGKWRHHCVFFRISKSLQSETPRDFSPYLLQHFTLQWVIIVT